LNAIDILPIEAEATNWDLIIIGTGIGAASFCYPLIDSGLNILFIEKGNFTAPEFHNGLTLKTKRTIRIKKPPIYHIVGGSSRLYAAQLERMKPMDFLGSDWGFDYDEISEYYSQAEKLFQIRGTIDPLFDSKQASSHLIDPPPLNKNQEIIYQYLKSEGLNPYRPHLGIQYKNGCKGCGGVLCKNNCKNDALEVFLSEIFKKKSAYLLSSCEVIKLEANEKIITGVLCKKDGLTFTLKSRFFSLSAGAIESPSILLNSGNKFWVNGLANSSNQVGRNLMWHMSDIFAVRNKTHEGVKSQKFISLNDFYIKGSNKLGTIQSVAVDLSSEVIYNFLCRYLKTSKILRFFPKILIRQFSKIAYFFAKDFDFFATIVEDFPEYKNRIYPNPKNRQERIFEYEISKDLRKRSRELYQSIKKVFKKKFFVFSITNQNQLNYGHACGTCRIGANSEVGVVNNFGNSFDIDNLIISDASVFPKSSGVNPSLTIAAFGLRAGKNFLQRIRKTDV
jgi:choline dehydrogenase-like flavoprotein